MISWIADNYTWTQATSVVPLCLHNKKVYILIREKYWLIWISYVNLWCGLHNRGCSEREIHDCSQIYPALIWRVLRDNLLWHHTSFLNLQSKSKVTEKFDQGEMFLKFPHPPSPTAKYKNPPISAKFGFQVDYDVASWYSSLVYYGARNWMKLSRNFVWHVYT
jgi:hypothetical protein